MGKSELVVRVCCIQCGAVRDIREGEMPANDVPMCDTCLMPMLTVSAHLMTARHAKSVRERGGK